LHFKLTGKYFLDETSAQMTCFYNILKGEWDRDIVKIAGIEESYLPEVIPSSYEGGRVCGEAADLLNIAKGTPVISGGHDQYCASLGAGAAVSGNCLLSCGTAWALVVSAGRAVFLPNSGWFPGRHFRRNSFGLMAAISNGGVMLDWFKNNIKPGRKIQGLKSRVKVMPGFASGEGMIKNISFADTGSDIYKAALLAIAFTVKKRLKSIKDVVEVKRLIMAGGGAKEKDIAGIIREATGKEVVLTNLYEAAGHGAALLAKGEVK